jgi:hypothetical protein
MIPIDANTKTSYYIPIVGGPLDGLTWPILSADIPKLIGIRQKDSDINSIHYYTIHVTDIDQCIFQMSFVFFKTYIVDGDTIDKIDNGEWGVDISIGKKHNE